MGDSGPVIVSGCFSVITPAHLMLIRAASDLAQMMEVQFEIVVDSDQSMKAQNRESILGISEKVSALRVFSRHVSVQDSMAAYIGKYKPRIWVKGWDRIGLMPDEDLKALESAGTHLMFMGPFPGPHASDIISRCKRSEPA